MKRRREFPGTSYVNRPVEQLTGFLQEQSREQGVLIAVTVPVLLLVAYYIMLASSLLLKRRETEFALLQSRGGSMLQLLGGYLFEMSMAGIISLVLGLVVAIGMAQVIGATQDWAS